MTPKTRCSQERALEQSLNRVPLIEPQKIEIKCFKNRSITQSCVSASFVREIALIAYTTSRLEAFTGRRIDDAIDLLRCVWLFSTFQSSTTQARLCLRLGDQLVKLICGVVAKASMSAQVFVPHELALKLFASFGLSASVRSSSHRIARETLAGIGDLQANSHVTEWKNLELGRCRACQISWQLALFSYTKCMFLEREFVLVRTEESERRHRNFGCVEQFATNSFVGVGAFFGSGETISTSFFSRSRWVPGLVIRFRLRKSPPAKPQLSVAQQVHASVYIARVRAGDSGAQP